MRLIVLVVAFLIVSISNSLLANTPSTNPASSPSLHICAGPFVTLVEPALSGSVQTRIDFNVGSLKNFSFRIGPEVAYFFLGTDFKAVFLGPSFGVFYERVLADNHVFSMSLRLPIHAIIGEWYGGSVSINPGIGYYFSNNIGVYGELGAQLSIAAKPDAVGGRILAVSTIGIAYRF